MKTIRLASLSMVILLAAWWAQPAQAQLGVAAGLNYDQFSDIQFNDREATFDNASGYHVGIFYDLAVGPLALRPGLFFRNISDIEYDFGFSGLGQRETFDLSLIEIPVDVRFRFAAPIIKPYAFAGPVFSFASTNDDNFQDNLENLFVSANIGAGIELAVPVLGISILPEIRYAFGITRYLKEEVQIGNATITAEDTEKLNTLMLRLGIAF